MSGSPSRALLFCAVMVALSMFFSPADYFCGSAYAQQNNNNSGNSGGNNNSNNNNSNSNWGRPGGWGWSVGGLAIDGQNAFRRASKQEVTELTKQVRTQMQAIPAGLEQSSSVRKISLKRLNEQLKKEIAASGTNKDGQNRISDSLLLLGGLTAIDYIVAVPEEKDIYLVGPAESWTIDEQGNIVGKESKKPILLLEDLLTVLRANSRQASVISCSIDPDKEALRRFATMEQITNPQQKQTADREAMGLMNVSFKGIPANSRMARVLSAADYRMKCISLGFESAAVKGLPSYSSMLHRGSGSFAPRFWLEPEYSTLLHDSQKLVWNMKETKVKALTEREVFDKEGNRSVTKKKDPAAQRWSKNMTNHYNELSKADPVFAEAKNCMDLALAVAIIYSQNLMDRVDNNFDALVGDSVARLPQYDEPKFVPSDSLVRNTDSHGSFVAVTGGVLINPWETVKNNTELKEDLAELKKTVAFEGNNWYAN